MPLLSVLPPPALVAACATPPQRKVLVLAGIDAWDIHPTVDTAELDPVTGQITPAWAPPLSWLKVGTTTCTDIRGRAIQSARNSTALRLPISFPVIESVC
jgi:hypothetical protein